MEYVNGDLGWHPVEIAATLREITDSYQFALYDPETEYIYLPDRLKGFGIRNPNQAKNALTLLKQVPDNFHYIGHYAKMLLAAYCWQGDALKYLRKKGGLSANETDVYVSQKGELLEGDVYTRLHRFWHAFGNYEQKNRAADAWLALEPELEPGLEQDEALFEAILYAAGEETKVREASGKADKESMRAYTWLNNRRWEKWLELRKQAENPDAPEIDWDRVGETLGLVWEMGGSFEDFKQSAISPWRGSQAQTRQENGEMAT